MKVMNIVLLGLTAIVPLVAEAACGDKHQEECCKPATSPCAEDFFCERDPCCTEILAEIRAAYFHPTGSRFDDIYGGSGIYNFEISVQTWCDLYTWLSVGYLRESGHSIGLKNRMTFQMVPLGLGLKYIFNCWCMRPYLGAGLGVTWMDTDNKSSFVIEDVSKWGVGGVFKSGVIYDFCSCMFLDLFIDYTYMNIGFSGKRSSPLVFRHDADISGFSFGAGLGFSF